MEFGCRAPRAVEMTKNDQRREATPVECIELAIDRVNRSGKVLPLHCER